MTGRWGLLARAENAVWWLPLPKRSVKAPSIHAAVQVWTIVTGRQNDAQTIEVPRAYTLLGMSDFNPSGVG